MLFHLRNSKLKYIMFSKVPLIGLQIDGINIDLPMVSVEKYLLEFPPEFSIFDDTFDENMNPSVNIM